MYLLSKTIVKRTTVSFLFFLFVALSFQMKAQPSSPTSEQENFVADTLVDIQIEASLCDSIAILNENLTDSVSHKVPLPITESDNPILYACIENWYGTPYRRSGMSLQGTDCSGFVLSIYKEVYNIDLLRSSKEMAQHAVPIRKEELKEGDLIFFRIRNSKMINHVGIYLKNGYFVHASASRGVIVDKLDQVYWEKYYCKSGRCFSDF